MNEVERHAVGRALKAAFFAARREGDDNEARILYSAACRLGINQYIPAGSFLSEVPK